MGFIQHEAVAHIERRSPADGRQPWFRLLRMARYSRFSETIINYGFAKMVLAPLIFTQK